MEKESIVKFPENYQKLTKESNYSGGKKTLRCLFFFVFGILIIHSAVSIWCLRIEVQELKKKIIILEMRAEVDNEMVKNLQNLIYSQLENENVLKSEENALLLNNEENNLMENDESSLNDEESNDDDDDDDDDETDLGFKRKREIQDFNEIFQEKNVRNDTEHKSKVQKSSTESSSLEKSSDYSSKDTFFPTSNTIFASSTRKPRLHRKHRKPKVGSAERFFTETHSTTAAPIQVRQSRTKITPMQGIDKTLWMQNQFQQHTSPHRETITKEEALHKRYKGYGRHLESVSNDLDSSRENNFDGPSYNMITIHFSADTSHYSKDRDPHYLGNGRMQIKTEIYKDWKPAHWTQGIDYSKYFHLHQGRVTVSTTGIYLIYVQIQHSNLQEHNGFSVIRNEESVAQCITSSTHDKHEVKSNTCGISTTILLQSNDTISIKDLHYGRYVVLTKEKSYFGLVLLSTFKN